MKVRFCSPVRSHIGYGELGRILVHQLLQAGVDVSVAPIRMGEANLDFGPLGAQAQARTLQVDRVDVNIVSMVPQMFARFRDPAAKNIGYTMFETDRLPPEWVVECNRMDAIWVPSEWGRQSFLASGVSVPIHVVGVHAEAREPALEPVEGPFRLLSMFDWQPRKNPTGLLRAYCAAFHRRKDTVLVLKAGHGGGSAGDSERQLQAAVASICNNIGPAADLPRIELASGLLSSEQVQRMHAGAHAYLSLSHGEGWGLPAWDSALLGKPVLHTGWSAPTEFLPDASCIAYRMAPVYGMHPLMPFHDGSMRWADPDLDDAIDKLRELEANYSVRADAAREHCRGLRERYSLPRRLEQLRAAL
ncbi:hypothetical protein [Arenimonas sp.]|uniref:hypothetical protein n=1 Tax=Arenimonas sp. TaxID=1872635 RepID=UPI0039E6F27C